MIHVPACRQRGHASRHRQMHGVLGYLYFPLFGQRASPVCYKSDERYKRQTETGYNGLCKLKMAVMSDGLR